MTILYIYCINNSSTKKGVFFLSRKNIFYDMKSLLSLFIFFTLLVKMGGYYAYLMIERENIREKIEYKIVQSIPKSALKCIIANPENIAKIEWRRSAKEFKFEGNLYDIVSIKIHKGTTYYFCINDQAETLLETKIDNLLEHQVHHLPFSDHVKHFLTLLIEPIIIHQTPYYFFNYFAAEYKSNFPQFLIALSSSILFEREQPPQF
jgi:hypothetical protein